ncbi:MAG TPA: NADH-quinone oxidoreductase subunit NuoE [Anaerolineae bacterium]|nr:NADH-quinone oxidoreductase subunit NuoE [Anaerolineae bacterium]
MLSEESRAEILRIRDEYPDPQSALLPALYLAQQDYGGWLPEAAFDEVAAVMELPATKVAAVATFYTMLNKKPVGKHLIQVCTNISCSLLGAEHLLAYLSRKLAIGVGETTVDGQFTLMEVECLGSCGTAPMMQVDDKYYENLTEEKIDGILQGMIEDGEGR